MKHELFFSFFICSLALGMPINVHSSQREMWESSHHIWNFGIIAASDKGMLRNPEKYFAMQPPVFNKNNYHNLRAGDIVWMKAFFVPDFCREILPTLTVPIVIVVADGDESFPSECGNNFDVNELLNNPFIVHLFAQNNDYAGPSSKVTSIPIGMDFHTIAYKGKQGGWGECGSPREQEAQLEAILHHLKPTHQRKKRAFVDFQLSDSMHGELQRYLKCGEDRKAIFEQLLKIGLIDHGGFMRRSELWAKKGEYAFSVSPHGNGLDCHRTWEDLILGCIVIVKTSSLDSLYEGLPVVIVKDWSEVTQENMDTWLSLYGDAFTNLSYREKLTHTYWFSKVKEMALPYR